VVKHGAQRRANHWINIPYICSPERATELGRPLLSFALSGLGSIVGAFPVVPHYAALRASPLATFCRAAGAGLVPFAKLLKHIKPLATAYRTSLSRAIFRTLYALSPATISSIGDHCWSRPRTSCVASVSFISRREADFLPSQSYA